MEGYSVEGRLEIWEIDIIDELVNDISIKEHLCFPAFCKFFESFSKICRRAAEPAFVFQGILPD